MTKKESFEKEAKEWANKMYPCDGQAQRYLLMGVKFGYSKAEEELVKAKEIVKKFSKFVNSEAELDPEYPEYSQELTDLWNELCGQAERFLNEVGE